MTEEDTKWIEGIAGDVFDDLHDKLKKSDVPRDVMDALYEKIAGIATSYTDRGARRERG